MENKKFVITRVAQDNMKMCAPGKAPGDCASILHEKGYADIVFKMPVGGKIKKALSTIFQTMRIRALLPRKCRVVVQYPVAPFFVKLIAFGKKLDVSILVHDIESIRVAGRMSADDIRSFCIANEIVVHTPTMKNLLVKFGVDSGKIKILHYFDYLTTKENQEKRFFSNEICFCGNLNKSKTLIEELAKQEGVHYNLYGAQKIENSENVSYMGGFAPEEISHIKGSWGLVWDGPSTDGCEGLLGEYLKINAPHKQSLYIAAELPLIVWSQSPSAVWVKERKLGIVVENLNNLARELSKVTLSDYGAMLKNVKELSLLLRNGKNLGSIMD